MPRFVSHPQLERSDVVANSTMNRERGLAGVNSYEAELRLNPLTFLKSQMQNGKPVVWLDLCCGSGRALLEAARQIQLEGWSDRVSLVGVDLVDMFADQSEPLPQLTLLTASLHDWSPGRKCDLVTCVHGMHYVGDKLDLLARAVSWLTPQGMFVANLDLANLLAKDGKPLARRLLPRFRAAGIQWDGRRRVIQRIGPTPVDFGLRYLGADDSAGPNYSGQPAVNSHYE